MNKELVMNFKKGELVRNGLYAGDRFPQHSKESSSTEMTLSWLGGKVAEAVITAKAQPIAEGLLIIDEGGTAQVKVLMAGEKIRQVQSLEPMPGVWPLAGFIMANSVQDEDEMARLIKTPKNAANFLKAADLVRIRLEAILEVVSDSMFITTKGIAMEAQIATKEEPEPQEAICEPLAAPAAAAMVSPVGTSPFSKVERTGVIKRITGWLSLANVRNMFLFGPQGTGKSTAAKVAAVDAGYLPEEIFTDNLYEGIQADHFMGGYVPLENGGFAWKEGSLVRAIKQAQATKAVFIMEEVNFLKAGVAGVLHEALMPVGGSITLENGEVLAFPETFKVIATANPEFSGTKEMNQAFLDRFQRLFDIKEMPKEVLIKRFREKINGLADPDSLTEKCFEIYESIRKKAVDEDRGVLVGPRKFLDWADEIALTKNIEEAAKVTIIPYAAALATRPDEQFASEIMEHIIKIKRAII